MNQKIAYEHHPITPERKEQLRALGYTIVDAKFRPANYKDTSVNDEAAPSNDAEMSHVDGQQHEPKRRGRPPNQG
jgi:hypothetical protein